MKKGSFPRSVLLGSIVGLAVVVVVVCLAHSSHKQYENIVVLQTQEQLLMSARSIAVGIEEFITEHLQVLRTVSINPMIQEQAYKGILVKKPPTGHCPCQDLYEAHKDHMDAFTMLDAKGIMLRRFPYIEERIGRDHSNKLDVAYVLREHKTHVSEVFFNDLGNLAISLSEPVFYNDEFAGIVRWMIQVDTIWKRFIETAKVGREGYAWILDNRNIILAHPREEFVGTSVLDFMRMVHKERGRALDEAEIEKHIRDEHDYLNKVQFEEEGSGMFLGCITGKDELTAYKRIAIGDKKWHLIINLPYSEIAGPIHEHARNTFGLVGIVIFVFGVLGILLFRTQKKKAELEAEARYLKDIAASAEALRQSKEKFAGIVDSVTDQMIMVDEQFNIVWTNDVAKDLFGPDLVGKRCYSTYHGRDEVCKPCIVKECLENGKVHQFETDIVVSDGTQMTFLCTAAVAAWDEDGRPKMVVEFLRDRTERKLAEERMRASLREKEVLLQEINHRVKNNMQIISSLLKLQAGYVDDRTYYDMFKESQNRIISMALVHEKLYQSEDLASIDLNEYITHLANALFRSYGADTGSVALKIDVADVVFGVDTAIPCGLIINELVSNSLKYAFPDGKEGEITIALRFTDGDEIDLTVSDNGVSIPDDLDLTNTGSLGLKLVQILTDQIRGRLEVDRSEGTSFRIRFKRIKYKERV